MRPHPSKLCEIGKAPIFGSLVIGQDKPMQILTLLHIAPWTYNNMCTQVSSIGVLAVQSQKHHLNQVNHGQLTDFPANYPKFMIAIHGSPTETEFLRIQEAPAWSSCLKLLLSSCLVGWFSRSRIRRKKLRLSRPKLLAAPDAWMALRWSWPTTISIISWFVMICCLTGGSSVMLGDIAGDPWDWEQGETG